MKTGKFISITLIGALLLLCACKNNKSKEPEPEYVFRIAPTELSFTEDGGIQKLILNVSNSWKAEVDADWCTLSKYEGDKDAFINVKAEASTSKKETTAVIVFSDTKGNSVSVTVKREGTGEMPEPIPTAEKCKASDYPQVTIGTQVWMAENYRCSKYDTQSEAYNASWLTNNTIPTSDSYTYTPYYTDASDKSKWNSSSKKEGINLSNVQVKMLGYLYNWAAAVGVADGLQQTIAFSGNRQGICPNGWHVPSKEDWDVLERYIYYKIEAWVNVDGRYLKTTSGWYNDGNGVDLYGFAALPAGYAKGNEVYHIGDNTNFWTDVTNVVYNYYADSYIIRYYDSGLYIRDENKIFGQSVRCLRN